MAHLLIYEPHAGGHQAEFLMWLAEAWASGPPAGDLVVAAPPKIAHDHPQFRERCAALGVTYVATEEAPAGVLPTPIGTRRIQALRRVMAIHDPARVLVTSFESILSPLALHARLPGRARLSALSLRPTLHYRRFESRPAPATLRAKRWMKARVTKAAALHPQLETLFSLDPTAVPALRALCPGVRVEGVPDPVPTDPVALSRDAIQARYGVEPERHLMILPGALESRKGALIVPEALRQLAPDVAERIAVLFAGRIDPAIDVAFREALARARAETRVQALLRDTFVPSDEIQAHVAAADTVLLLYNAEHVGSSGFLMRAAGAGVPVLCTADGLMGHLTRTHRLGRTVAPEPAAVASALTLALHDSEADPASAAAFAAAHTVQAFTDALLGPLRG